MAECIFVDKPKECIICLEPRKLSCLLNHLHLLLTEQGKDDIVKLVKENANSPTRYKAKSGQEGRER